jgi:hypothetical protein
LLLFAPAWTRSEALVAHARLFFSDFVPSAQNVFVEKLAAQVRDADSSIHDYIVYLLLDFAAADPAMNELPLVQALEIADGFHLRSQLEQKAVQELKVTKKTIATLREEGRSLLAKAATQC